MDFKKTLRVMTYNVHSCVGSDGRASTRRIAEVIARYSPDVAALQELDAHRPRTNGEHQARDIARHLDMEFHFHPSFEIEDEQYGNAILSKYPIKVVRAGALPTHRGRRKLEKRGALWAEVRFRGREIQVINTHLGLKRRERMAQAEALLGEAWATHSSCRAPVIVCGDMNSLPVSPVYKRFLARFTDAQSALNNGRPRGTYPSLYPLARIDHIFTSPGVEVRDVHIPWTRLTAAASDHLPLIAELKVL